MKKTLAIFDPKKSALLLNSYHQAAMNAAAQMAAYAVVAGLELQKLRKAAGHGNWEDEFEKLQNGHSVRFDIRTARRYIALADGVKGRALKNETVSFLALMDVAPSHLEEKDRDKLIKTVSKLTDGETLTELYQDFGIVKKPKGSAPGGARPKKNLTPEEKLQNEHDQALSGWKEMLERLAVETYGVKAENGDIEVRPSWEPLTTAEIKDLLKELSAATKYLGTIIVDREAADKKTKR